MKKKLDETDRKTAVNFIHTPDSIQVSRNAKGEASWSIKVYFDSDEGNNNAHEKVIKKMAKIDDEIRKKFPDLE